MAHAEDPHVIIVGGGFAGLWATRALASAPVRITLLDRCNHHLFQPLLYQVATAGLSAPDIAAPLRHVLRRQRNVTVLLADVARIDAAQSSVVLADATTVEGDYLVLAAGSTHAYFGHPQWAANAPGLKTLDDALHLRRRLLLAFERAEAEEDPQRQAAWLNFAIIGGGPTGVELAGTLAEIARHTLKREFRRIDPANARIRLIETGSRLLASYPESLSENARRHLERLGVEVLLGAPVTDISAEGVRVGAEFIAARSVVWAAGVAASPLGQSLGTPLDPAGRVLVDADLSIARYPNIFVAGDLARLPDQVGSVPAVAPAAKQMGRHVAQTIRARLAGRTGNAFRYRNYSNLATIGRMAAVVEWGRIRLTGAIAWWFWLAAHIFFLIGFRNRLIVLLEWAWAYATYQRNARIILHGADPIRANTPPENGDGPEQGRHDE